MILTWSALGVLIGIGFGAAEKNLTQAILAGGLVVLVMPVQGLLLGLLGGRPRAMLCGAALGGLLLTALSYHIGERNFVYAFALGLNFGGVLGSVGSALWCAAGWLFALVVSPSERPLPASTMLVKCPSGF
jgi:hypothetical protein